MTVTFPTQTPPAVIAKTRRLLALYEKRKKEAEDEITDLSNMNKLGGLCDLRLADRDFDRWEDIAQDMRDLLAEMGVTT